MSYTAITKDLNLRARFDESPVNTGAVLEAATVPARRNLNAYVPEEHKGLLNDTEAGADTDKYRERIPFHHVGSARRSRPLKGSWEPGTVVGFKVLSAEEQQSLLDSLPVSE